MADEIKQPGNIGSILPLNRARCTPGLANAASPPEKSDRQSRTAPGRRSTTRWTNMSDLELILLFSLTAAVLVAPWVAVRH